MRGWLLTALVVGVVLAASLPALGLTVLADRPDGASDRVSQVSDSDSARRLPRAHDRRDDDGDGRDGLGRGHRFGPPPWARGEGLSSAHRGHRGLTPPEWGRERARLAREHERLAREHARAVERWAACVAAGRDDCSRRTPPGHLRRR